MQKFNGYEEAKAYGEYESLKLGGHICKILEVKIENIKTKDGNSFDQLILKIDIAEPDEQAGYYNRKFARDAAEDALKAKWKGYHRISIPTDKSEDFVKSGFKTLITSIEKSNPGYKWNWEEQQLVGKLFGGVFGIEEFKTDDGRIIGFSRCRYVRSIEKIEEIEIPKVRLVDKTLMDYTEWLEKKKAEKEGNSSNQTSSSSEGTSVFEGNNDDLPF